MGWDGGFLERGGNGAGGGQRVWTAAASDGCEGVALLGCSQAFPVWGGRDMRGEGIKGGFVTLHLVKSEKRGGCCVCLFY